MTPAISNTSRATNKCGWRWNRWAYHRQLAGEIERYERIKRGEFDVLRNLERLGELLIAVRIYLGLSQAELAEHIYGDGMDRDTNALEVLVGRLRRKLGETAQEPHYLHTVRGVGVKLVEP